MLHSADRILDKSLFLLSAHCVSTGTLSGIAVTHIFDLPWKPKWTLAATGGALGMLAALVAGLSATQWVAEVLP